MFLVHHFLKNAVVPSDLFQTYTSSNLETNPINTEPVCSFRTPLASVKVSEQSLLAQVKGKT